MDLHTIVKNLHTGKRSISDKNFSTILNINEVEESDSNIVGDYYSNIAFIKKLIPKNIHKEGFILTHQGIIVLLQESSILKNIINILKKSTLKNIDKTANSLKEVIQSITFSELLQVQILKAYHSLQEQNLDVLLRVKVSFSHNNDKKIDLPQEQFLYASNEKELFKSIISALLFFYSRDNIYLRKKENIKEDEISLAIGFEVVKSVSISGICSSLDFKSGHTSIIQIQSGYGDEVYNRIHLCSTDSFQIFKKGLEKGFDGILPPLIATKKHLTTLTKEFHNNVVAYSMKTKEVSKKNQTLQSLNTVQLKQLSNLLTHVEDSLQKYYKKYTPIKFYFTLVNEKGSTKNLQFNIEDVVFEKKYKHLQKKEMASYELITPQNSSIGSGIAIGDRITHGFVKFIKKEDDLYTINNEDIVVTHSTFPHWEPYLRNAKGLIVEQGSEYSHSSQICYEYNIPAVINTGLIKNKLIDKSVVTLNCMLEEGFVYPSLEKYTLKVLNEEYLKEFRELKNKHNSSITQIAQLTNRHNILEKSHLPFNSQIIENIFDLISKKHESYKLNSNSSTIYELIKNEIIRNLSKVAISNYPQDVWVNIASFSPLYYELISNNADETYFTCSKQKGISRALKTEFESHIKFIISTLNCLYTKIGCKNVSLYVDNVQQQKEVKQLKDLLQKYNYKSSLGGILDIGGILNIDELMHEFDMVMCNLDALKASCGVDNRDAIIKLSRFFIQRGEELNESNFNHSRKTKKNKKIENNTLNTNKLQKNDSLKFTQLGLFNLNITDTDIFDALKNSKKSLHLLSCEHKYIIPLYSYLIESLKGRKIDDSKFVKRIEFN